MASFSASKDLQINFQAPAISVTVVLLELINPFVGFHILSCVERTPDQVLQHYLCRYFHRF